MENYVNFKLLKKITGLTYSTLTAYLGSFKFAKFRSRHGFAFNQEFVDTFVSFMELKKLSKGVTKRTNALEKAPERLRAYFSLIQTKSLV